MTINVSQPSFTLGLHLLKSSGVAKKSCCCSERAKSPHLMEDALGGILLFDL